MKRRTFTGYGMAANGQLMIKNIQEMNEFVNQWPKGEFTFELTINEPKTSDALICFYKRHIVPEFQNAFKVVHGEVLTYEKVDLKLREMSTWMKKQVVVEGQAGWIDVTLPIETAGNHRSTEYIKELKMIASQEYDFVIK